MTATYLGIKGTRGVQEYLAEHLSHRRRRIHAPHVPLGFVYRTSNGNSTREAGQHSVATKTAQRLYRVRCSTPTRSRSTTTRYWAARGLSQPHPQRDLEHSDRSCKPKPPVPAIAQNWLDLNAERGLSTFDQRNLLNAQIQYTTGVGLGGGTLLSGWRGKLLKRWTVLGQITAGSGLPQTPIYLAAVPGTGVTGSIRPNVTGASVYDAPAGFHLNAAAYSSASCRPMGRCGKKFDHRPRPVHLQRVAGAHLPIEGSLQSRSAGGFDEPAQPCCLHQLEYDVESDVESGLNPALNSPLFGLPAAANAMRSLQTTMRLRF